MYFAINHLPLKQRLRYVKHLFLEWIILYLVVVPVRTNVRPYAHTCVCNALKVPEGDIWEKSLLKQNFKSDPENVLSGQVECNDPITKLNSKNEWLSHEFYYRRYCERYKK